VAAQIDYHTPAGGSSIDGGEDVIVVGTGFTGATAVTFGPLEAFFTVDSDTQITAVAPPAEPGISEPGWIRVWHDGEASPAGLIAQWTWCGTTLADIAAQPENFVPHVEQTIPAGSATTAGGEAVRIEGRNFAGVYAVRIGPFPVDFTVESDSVIHVVAPAYHDTVALDHVYPRVFNRFGGNDPTVLPEWTWGGRTMADLSERVDDDAPFEVHDYEPKDGASLDGGDDVTVTGKGFTGVTDVWFGPLRAPEFWVLSDEQVLVVAPPYDPAVVYDAPARSACTAGRGPA
jgi:hypothetical protein